MRILAVIPACEGSAVFPNKNMRILRGKPLIYYAISNALRSRHITDVIVSSNSSEILSLGRQMGVMTRNRRPELCSIQVSLDAVVWDVFEQLDRRAFDYVVTMQSISPTLKVETLDAAIERTLSGGYDTMISVRNQASFFWRVLGGQAVPQQEERMNRNLLPPFYRETGAFLITRTTCVSPDTRIGEQVGLCELSGDESIDIDNFGDLILAENAMRRQKTAIFVNGNAEIGLGHIMRTLQIADELFTKPDFYYDRSQTDPASFGETAYALFPVDGEAGFVEAMSRKAYDLIVNDVLNTTEEYMRGLRGATLAAVVNFEDNGPGARNADLVINALYEDSEHDNVVTGSRYFILSKLFLIYPPIPIRERVQRVMVTFGGADPRNYSETLLNLACEERYRDVQFVVVLGKANRNVQLMDGRYKRSNITILRNINNMSEVMSGCDAAVSSRGRTCFELAALGIPTLSIAQHAREELHTFVCEENGFLCLSSEACTEEIAAQLERLVTMSREERRQRQRKLLSHDLRNGRRNVVEQINQLQNRTQSNAEQSKSWEEES